MIRSLLLMFVFLVPASAMVVARGDTDTSWWRDGETAPWSFGALDADSDGKISQNEMAMARMQFATALKQTKASLIAAVDLDHSGKMSRYEAAEASKRWISLRDRARDMALAAYDKNRDGKLTEDESLALETRIGHVFASYGAHAVDKNRDQNLSRPEVRAAIAAIREGKGAMFTLCDRTNDGQISVQEANMAFALLAVAAGLSNF